MVAEKNDCITAQITICLQRMPQQHTSWKIRWSETYLTLTGEPDDLEILHVRFGGGRLEKYRETVTRWASTLRAPYHGA